MASCLCAVTLAAPAEPRVPHLGDEGQAAYQHYLTQVSHKAFAIAPGGAWAWKSDLMSVAQAQTEALEACQATTRQKCVLYASDERTVFNAQAWPLLWGPYATTAQAAKVTLGTAPGQRMVDITYRDEQGHSVKLSSLKGKVVVLHFWGSWCPPCRQEMPELVKLHQAMADRKDVVFVLLQIRESFETARRWAQNQQLALPLFDSGSRSPGDTRLQLADGTSMADRDIARSFPSSYVLDKQGLVIFSQPGPVQDWLQYEAFLRDAAKRSGK